MPRKYYCHKKTIGQKKNSDWLPDKKKCTKINNIINDQQQ